MRALADEGMVTGESGACTAGLLLCDDLGLPSDAVVLLLCTEGATDPAKWEQVVGRPPS
jgi:diaminopropionate ammonia-lyase